MTAGERESPTFSYLLKLPPIHVSIEHRGHLLRQVARTLPIIPLLIVDTVARAFSNLNDS